MTQTVDFSNGHWYRSFLERSTDHTYLKSSSSDYLADNRTKPFLERYFSAIFIPDVAGEPYNDMCVLRHSNELFVVGLAPGHYIFRGCRLSLSDRNCEALKPHTILGLDYQVTPRVNRMENPIQGKKKKNAQSIAASSDPIAFAVCSRGVQHKLCGTLPGRLIEVNTKISLTEPKCLNGSLLPIRDNVKKPPYKPLPLMPLGDPRGGWDYGSIGLYICIIAPYERRCKLILRQIKKRRHSRGSQPVETLNPVTDDEEESGQDEDYEAAQDAEPGDMDVMNDENQQELLDFVAKLSKQRALTWDEYAKLRGLF